MLWVDIDEQAALIASRTPVGETSPVSSVAMA